jgi:hypothetical protein
MNRTEKIIDEHYSCVVGENYIGKKREDYYAGYGTKLQKIFST